MHEIKLEGCRTRPLASYLKALGVFRILGEQADSSIASRWGEAAFEVRTRLTAEELIEFFMEDWTPCPIVAPWNGGSGFYRKDFTDAIDAISTASSARFAEYQQTIQAVRKILDSSETEKPGKDQKAELILRLRNTLSDAAIRWIDAALLLTSRSIKYPALLGTGGNDGRLEFTNNYMQRIVSLIDDEGRPMEGAEESLQSALFDAPSPTMKTIAVGQFSPLGAGGANTTTGFGGGVPTNSWDYVFMIEGALMFSAAATRRAEHADVRVSYPFMVESTSAGSGGAALQDDSTTRAEIWLPLWGQYMALPEAFRLFSDGRLTVGKRIAKDGVDAIRAVGQYGIDRGLTAFERYQFSQRNGLSYFATPQGRIEVKRQPLVDLVALLERGGWLDRVRRAARGPNATASLIQNVSLLENAIFDLAKRGDGTALEDLTIAIGSLHRLIARSRELQEKIRPLSLRAGWVRSLLTVGTEETSIATALALMGGKSSPIALNLLPFDIDKGELRWRPGSTEVVQAANLTGLLAGILQRRVLNRLPDFGEESIDLFSSSYGCDLDSWIAYLESETDNEKILSLLYALSLIRGSYSGRPPERSTKRVLASKALLKLTVPHWHPRRDGSSPQIAGSRARLTDVVHNLRGGRAERAIASAELYVRTWTNAKFPETHLELSTSPEDATRVIASLLIPLDQDAWRQLEREVIEIPVEQNERETDKEEIAR